MSKILVVDDHAIVRKGVILILHESPGIEATFDEASDAGQAERKIIKEKYDLVLLDISMPEGDGLELLKKLHRLHPKLPILVLSMFPEEQFAIRALTLGAVGYLTKDNAPDELVVAVRKVLSGGRYITSSIADRIAGQLGSGWDKEGMPHERLSDREFQVLRMIGEGKTATRIAEALFISVKTVGTYRSRILQKMAMTTNAELMCYALKNNLVN